MIAHKTKAAMPGRLSLNALLKHFKITRLATGGQRMSQLNFEYADFIQDFVLARMGAPGILRGFNTEVQTSTGRLAYGHHNPLKKNQDGNSRLAQNILNLLNLRNCRGMREPPNPLNHLDYNDSLELANWLILFNSVELTDLDNPLITPRNADGVVRLPQIEVLERINNLVTDGYLVHGSATIGSWRGDAFLYHEENQQSPALDCEPDLAYERVVPKSHEVNQLSLSESDSQPSLRGLVDKAADSHSVLRPSTNGEWTKKKGRALNQALRLVGCCHIYRKGSKARIRALSYRQTTENSVVNYNFFVGQLSGSLVMIQIVGIQRLYIWFLIFFSRFLNSFLSSSSSAFNALYFSGIPFNFIAEMANCSSFASLRSGGKIESGLSVISAAVCLQSTVAGQSHVIPICPAISNTTTSYRSVLLLLSAENLYSIVFLRSGACSLIAYAQPFCSISRCCNSFRTIRLSQAERVASPSSCIAASIASSSAGSTRKAICLLPFGIFMFDMCLTLGVIFVVSRNVHHMSYTCKARSPAVLPALTGLLTKPLIGVTVMAGSQHTQTHPEFTWLFLGTRANDTAAPTVLRTTASTEFEARADFPGWNLTFAAKIRTESPFITSWTCPESMTLWSLHGTDISYLNEMTGGNHA